MAARPTLDALVRALAGAPLWREEDRARLADVLGLALTLPDELRAAVPELLALAAGAEPGGALAATETWAGGEAAGRSTPDIDAAAAGSMAGGEAAGGEAAAGRSTPDIDAAAAGSMAGGEVSATSLAGGETVLATPRARPPTGSETLLAPPPAASATRTIGPDGPSHAPPRSGTSGRIERLRGPGDGAPAGPRYEDLGLIGRGGRGEVRRVHDHDLGRTLAMKLIGEAVTGSPGAEAKFVEEAQIGARLQHPGIVPIYEIGRLADGRLYFTMQEIHGSDLGVHIGRLHAERRALGGDYPAMRRMIDVFHRVCVAVAFAHARGVVHRDLKPANIMVGDEGEVLVVDWGIAKALGSARSDEARGPAVTGGAPQFVTAAGSVVGTPAYMAPEQLLGQGNVDARTDVYALGMVLYEILAGAPPTFVDSHWTRRALEEVPPLTSVASGRSLPEALVDICHRALRLDPRRRYPHAGALARAIGEWLEGVRQREQALALVDEAAMLASSAAAARREAAELREQATANLQQIPAWANERIKHPLWRQLYEAERLTHQATQYHLKSEQRLHAALTFEPGLVEAHQALALRYAAEHADAEAHKREDDAARAEFYLRSHVGALPTDSPVQAQLLTYLRAEGALSLTTDPPEATITIVPYVLRDRRLHQGAPLGEAVRAPLVDHALPVGSYLLRVAAPGRETTLYPLAIQRGRQWSATRPGADRPTPLWLPPLGSLRAGDAYVPAGWFRAGGDPAALNALPACDLWVDGFVIRREPITNAEYLEFLNDRVAAGAEAEALQCLPIDSKPSPPTPLYRRGADGRFVCNDGVVPEWPVVFVDWPSARRFCRWLAARDGLPWRLPDELEWEKAARGVDGRLFPWGDFLDPSWCWIRDSHPQTPSLAPTRAHPVDCSPYGVFGMVGNSMDWCANAYVQPDQFAAGSRLVTPEIPDESADTAAVGRVYRGGSWSYHAQLCRPVRRFRHHPATRVNDLGLRPVRSLG
ncbi:MAG: SUMF1/EgtB/PvdO family nonheme iron enzyme [Myxococcales bacterium]|nr:SUMF1/EgtB/PvdO family nonheme iron enzyme [Myxococcales bacterium]